MKTSPVLYFFIGIIFMTSCGELREEITFNKDGSGKYEMSSDMIPMMRNMMTGIVKMTAEEGEAMDSAALAAKVEEMVWKDFPEKIDSTLSLDSDLPPEIKNDPEAMALLNQTTVYMRGGRSEGYIKTGLEFDFTSADEFQKFLKMLEENSKNSEQGNAFGQSKTEINITPTSFVRTIEGTHKAKDDPSMAQLLPMMQQMSMLTVINFPKKIEKVDLVHYEIVEQSEKSITLKYDFMKAMEDETKSEIRIVLK